MAVYWFKFRREFVPKHLINSNSTLFAIMARGSTGHICIYGWVRSSVIRRKIGWYTCPRCFMGWNSLSVGSGTKRLIKTLRWRHNELDGVSDHQPQDCLLNRLFGRRSKNTPKLRVTGLYAVNSPGTGEFLAQMASNAENVSIWWRHYENNTYSTYPTTECGWWHLFQIPVRVTLFLHLLSFCCNVLCGLVFIVFM